LGTRTIKRRVGSCLEREGENEVKDGGIKSSLVMSPYR